MLIYLSGEGKRDVGGLADRDYGDPMDEGFFQPLLRRLVDGPVEFCGVASSLSLGPEPPRSLTGKLEQRAHQAVALADLENCDLVVIHTDADEKAAGKKVPKKYESRRAQVQKGIDAAGSDRPPAVPAVPIATTEAWALADPEAVKARRAHTKHGNDLRKAPETLWGAPHDPTSNHPKMLLERVLGHAASHGEQAAIAAAMDLDVARKRCPLSLEPFIAEVLAAIG